MKRNVYEKLLNWKQSELRKPLILKGARQVGKTYILKEFARKEYDNFAYLNFEDDPALDAIFMHRFDKQKIVSYLSSKYQKTGETMVKIFLIAGARPNFMKIAPIYREASKHGQVVCKIVHTGQHYDYEMSRLFLKTWKFQSLISFSMPAPARTHTRPPG